jgi:hypothetical protein
VTFTDARSQAPPAYLRESVGEGGKKKEKEEKERKERGTITI